MTVREAESRIDKIEDIIRSMTSSDYVLYKTGDIADLLQEYRNVLRRAINKAEVDI